MVANLSVKVRICIWFEKSGFLGTGIVLKLQVSEQNLFFCPTVQVVHHKKHCIATIFDDQKCFQYNQDRGTQKARFFKSDANSDFDR